MQWDTHENTYGHIKVHRNLNADMPFLKKKQNTHKIDKKVKHSL